MSLAATMAAVIGASPLSVPGAHTLYLDATGLNDADAVQHAIDAVATHGGVVHLRAGLYRLRVSDGVRALRPRRNVAIVGDGVDQTVLVVDAGTAAYKSVFYPGRDVAEDMTGFSLRDITIDQAASVNPIRSAAQLIDEPRAIVTIFSGSNIRVENCRFTDVAGTNTLIFNGPHVADVEITNNRFDNVGNVMSVHFDHSTIYAHAERVKITGNTFRGRSTQGGAFGAPTAIETHGSEYIVSQNTIDGYVQGMSITGVADASGTQLITDNTITNAMIGIQLWSNVYKSRPTGSGLTDVSVANNLIILNREPWLPVVSPAPAVTAGILLNARSDALLEHLIKN